MTDPVDAVLRHHDHERRANARVAFIYDIDPDAAYQAALALQTMAIDCRRHVEARPGDSTAVWAGRRVTADLADVYDRVAAALMRPNVDVGSAGETPLGEAIDGGADAE